MPASQSRSSRSASPTPRSVQSTSARKCLRPRTTTLRFRKLTIEPGGIVPWHSHDDRPALIYVAEGEIIEYASNCCAADRAQGRRNPSRDARHIALVEEPRRQDRRSLRRRRAARQERPQHVIRLRGASPAPPSTMWRFRCARKRRIAASSRKFRNVQELAHVPDIAVDRR